VIDFIHPPFSFKEKWCTSGQNFKNKHGIYGPEKALHSYATPASSHIQHGFVGPAARALRFRYKPVSSTYPRALTNY